MGSPSLPDLRLETASSSRFLGEAGGGLLLRRGGAAAPSLQQEQQQKQRRGPREMQSREEKEKLRQQDEELTYYLALLKESGMKTMVGAVNFADSKIAAKKNRRSSLPTGELDAGGEASSNANSNKDEGKGGGGRPEPARQVSNSRRKLLSEALQQEKGGAAPPSSSNSERNYAAKTEVAKMASLLNAPVPTLMDIWRRGMKQDSKVGKGSVSNSNSAGDGLQRADDSSKDRDAALEAITGNEGKGAQQTERGERRDDDHSIAAQEQAMELLETWGNASGGLTALSRHSSVGSVFSDGHDFDGSELLEGWCNGDGSEHGIGNGDRLLHESLRSMASKSSTGVMDDACSPCETTGEKEHPFAEFKRDPGFAPPA